jgi:hypothetical protein
MDKETFILRQNIVRYTQQLMTETNAIAREMLQKLLAEEMVKQAAPNFAQDLTTGGQATVANSLQPTGTSVLNRSRGPVKAALTDRSDALVTIRPKPRATGLEV